MTGCRFLILCISDIISFAGWVSIETDLSNSPVDLSNQSDHKPANVKILLSERLKLHHPKKMA